jgi:hypothetical protein
MTPISHRVRLVTPSRTGPHEPDEWPDWLVGVVLVLLVAFAAGAAGIILTVVWRAYWRIFHAG